MVKMCKEQWFLIFTTFFLLKCIKIEKTSRKVKLQISVIIIDFNNKRARVENTEFRHVDVSLIIHSADWEKK